MKRILLAAAATLAAAFAVALMPGAAVGASTSPSTTNLSCNDGTNLNLALDATALTQLTSAVTALTLFPAGLSCSLSPTPPPPPGSGNPQHDYAVGGGQVQNGPFTTNFALSAHVNDTDAVSPPTSGGTFNLTDQPFLFFPGGHLVSKPDCLHVEGTTAYLSALVTHADGSFANKAGQEIYVQATPDMIGWSFSQNTSNPCNSGAYAEPLLHGNVNVHDADGPS